MPTINNEELAALLEIVKTVNGWHRCWQCGAHREQGWMEKHRSGCTLKKHWATLRKNKTLKKDL